MATQVKFKDTENNVTHIGIRYDNGDIICGCCGGVIPFDEQVIEYGFELIKEYKDWINFSNILLKKRGD
jgi:hypothetical protein